MQPRTGRMMRSLPRAGALIGLTAIATVFAFSTAQARAHRERAPRAVSASTPVLGLASTAPTGSGFGTVKPRTVSYGGDPTSLVTDVKWQSWGGARAVGHGTADWVWPGWCVACGSVNLHATVVAFDRTSCQGQSAYARVEWFFPSRGMTFSRRLGGPICGQGPSSGGSFKEVKCRPVGVDAHGVVAAIASGITMYRSPITCASARRFIARSGAARYLGRNARYNLDGWWCGSELLMDASGPQSFSCEKGDFTNVSFNLRAS